MSIFVAFYIIAGVICLQLQVNSYEGIPSPRTTATMTNFFPPAVVGFVTEMTDMFMINRTDFLSTRCCSTVTSINILLYLFVCCHGCGFLYMVAFASAFVPQLSLQFAGTAVRIFT